jgi:hypothetical protein
MKSLNRLVPVLAIVSVVTCYARADNIDFSHITIVDNSTPFNADFDVSNIARNNANWPNTDGFGFASQGAGTDTFVDFQFDQPYIFSEVTYVDRLHSGAAANVIGGTADFVTNYDLIFSTNSTFGDGDDSLVSVGPRTVPTPPNTVDEFVTVTSIPNITAQYLRFDVQAITGGAPNNGGHTFLFNGVVPEPATAVSLLIGLCGMLTFVRRRKR